jgi:hypothetical protein
LCPLKLFFSHSIEIVTTDPLRLYSRKTGRRDLAVDKKLRLKLWWKYCSSSKLDGEI